MMSRRNFRELEAAMGPERVAASNARVKEMREKAEDDMEPELKELFKGLLAEHTSAARSITELTALINRQAELADARAARFEEGATRLQEAHLRTEEAHLRTEEAIAHLALTVDKYVASGDARAKRLEENLDGLIQAIAREHSNGKKRE